jgi:ubiquitin related modifier 1
MTRITIELGGGLDHLFGGVKVHEVDVPAAASATMSDGADANAAAADANAAATAAAAAAAAAGQEPLTVARLLPWARDHLLKERPELFMKGDSV